MSAPGLEPETKEMFEFVQRIERELEKLTYEEQELLGDSVGLDERSVPLYIVQLI